jgi:plastocyanin
MRGRQVLGLCVAGLLALGACGDSDDGDGGGAQLEGQVNDHGSEEVADGAIEVAVDDFYFSPTFLDAAPGDTIEVSLRNEGDSSHTFTIDSQGVDEELQAGAAATVQVTVPDSGSVEFFCRFHSGQGMRGALVASEGVPAGGGSGTTASTVATTEGAPSGRYDY